LCESDGFDNLLAGGFLTIFNEEEYFRLGRYFEFDILVKLESNALIFFVRLIYIFHFIADIFFSAFQVYFSIGV
jgi:hypothetical protein